MDSMALCSLAGRFLVQNSGKYPVAGHQASPLVGAPAGFPGALLSITDVQMIIAKILRNWPADKAPTAMATYRSQLHQTSL